MDNINVLLVNADRGINSLIEAAALDVCYNQALVHFTRTAELSEFVRLAPSDAFRLMIVVAEHAFLVQKHPVKLAMVEDVVDAIASVRRPFSPLLVVSMAEENRHALTEAGADSVMKFPFNRESLTLELRRVLKMRELREESPAERWGQAGMWLRLLQRLRSA